jgi:hypothetical protein
MQGPLLNPRVLVCLAVATLLEVGPLTRVANEFDMTDKPAGSSYCNTHNRFLLENQA